MEFLALQGNRISSLDELQKLASLKGLKTIYLKNLDGTGSNPVCEHPSYRSVVMRCFPQLVTLDGERMKAGVGLQQAVPGLTPPGADAADGIVAGDEAQL